MKVSSYFPLESIRRANCPAVVNNEHLTEALRRLRKNSSDNNVDRRLVTNILLSFLTTHRADSKRFEMLSLLSTILSWDDAEREKAGLQRMGATGTPSKSATSKGKGKAKQNERSAEEEAAMNEANFLVLFPKETQSLTSAVIQQPLCRVPAQRSFAWAKPLGHDTGCHLAIAIPARVRRVSAIMVAAWDKWDKYADAAERILE